MALKWKLCVIIFACLLAACQPASKPYQWNIPQDFPEPVVPQHNPMSDAKVALGRALFYDKALSFNGEVACASCHQQQFAFSDPRQFSVGAQNETTKRNSLALVNVAYNGSLTWAHNGLDEIEQQILIPLFTEHPIEMGVTGNEQQILKALDSEKYSLLSEEAFGQALDFDVIVQALASFVRSLTSFNSDFDRYTYQMQDDALSESAIRGLDLFFSERLECFHCHGGFNFTQSSKHDFQQLDLRPFHHTGLYNTDVQGAYPESDQGLIEITQQASDMGRFRAPTLRNIAVTAPYMHDGSIATLSDVIDFYAQGGRGKGKHSPLKSIFVKGFELTEQEKQDLLAFLHSLTDEEFLTNPDHAKK